MTDPATNSIDTDLCIVGGGLAGGLIALAMARERPDVRLLLVEGADTLGGNHVWSFFDSDVDHEDRLLIAPMIGHHWDGHDVRFPEFARTLAGGYNSITSHAFHAHLQPILGDRVLTGIAAVDVGPQRVALADGTIIAAKAVIDARGGGDLDGLACGWQKFLGRRLKLAAPHGLTRPVIMDATVDQAEGYRFVYLLPFGEREIFVEDTYYSDSPGLDLVMLEQRIADYAATQGWQVEAMLGQEVGVLPVLTGGRFDRFWPKRDPLPRAGVRAAIFHPTTGYSLPLALDFALHFASLDHFDVESLQRFSRIKARLFWKRWGFYRLLARMLFRAAQPAGRWKIFARFYRLPEPLIARFYAVGSTKRDKMRILCGRPPVPISAAMRAMMSKG